MKKNTEEGYEPQHVQFGMIEDTAVFNLPARTILHALCRVAHLFLAFRGNSTCENKKADNDLLLSAPRSSELAYRKSADDSVLNELTPQRVPLESRVWCNRAKTTPSSDLMSLGGLCHFVWQVTSTSLLLLIASEQTSKKSDDNCPQRSTGERRGGYCFCLGYCRCWRCSVHCTCNRPILSLRRIRNFQLRPYTR